MFALWFVGSSDRLRHAMSRRLLTAAGLMGISLVVSAHARDVAPPRGPLADPPNVAFLRYRVVPTTTQIEFNGELQLTAELQNLGKEKLTVYWGDYAHPKMYHFDVTHESGKRLALTRSFYEDPLPHAAQSRFFVTIDPGASVKYPIFLTPSPGANGQYAYFRRVGKFRVEPSLSVVTTDALDPKSGNARRVPGTWTGLLTAEPFTITVVDGAQSAGRGVTIEGRVIDEHGKPVADTLVVASQRVTPPPSVIGKFMKVVIDQSVTDDNGHFEFAGLPAASPSFELETHSDDYPQGRAVLLNQTAADGTAKALTAEIKLPPSVTLKGRVVDSAGQPCVDARLEFYPPARHTFTDDQGRFAIKGMPIADEYRPRLWRRGFAEKTVQVSRETATNGEWTITLAREQEQSFSGQVAFASGRPFTGMKLAMSLVPADRSPTRLGPGRYTHGAIVEGGSYRCVLPSAEPFDVTALLKAEDVDLGTPTPVLRQTVGRVSAGQENIDIIFDDRQTLGVRVSPTTEIREPIQFQVSCVFLASGDEGGDRTVAVSELSAAGGNVEFSRLCPGKYRVDLTTKPIEFLRESLEIQLTSNSRDPQVLQFQPELKFGRLTGQIVTADDRPVKAVYASGQRTSLGSVKLDQEGRFELIAPEGEVRLFAVGDGPNDARQTASIKFAQTTDLGRVVWPARAERASAWVEGRVLYDDGTPALGAIVGGMMRNERVTANGSYRWQIRDDMPKVTIDLANADGWPRPDLERRLASSPFNGDDQWIELTVPLEPDKVVVRDVVLPRKQASSLVIRNVDAPLRPLSLFVRTPLSAAHTSDKPAPAARQDELQFVHRAFGYIEAGGSKTIDGVPLGRCLVTVGLSDYSVDAYHVDVTDTQKPAELRLDSKDLGQIELRVSDANDMLRRNLGVRLTKLLGGTKILCFDSFSHPGAKQLERLSKSSDGVMILRDLSAGSYELTVRDGELSKKITSEVAPRGHALVELRASDLQKAGQ